MANNSWAWNQKDSRKEKAQEHTKAIERKYQDLVNRSVNGSIIYSANTFSDNIFVSEQYVSDTEIIVDNIDSVGAILKYAESGSNIAVLNFASYKKPGGMFLEGSMAQEEALCHDSILYNVLREFPEYYKENQSNLNRALYTNRAIFSPDVIFKRIEGGRCLEQLCGVITCAAPNKGAAQKYQNVSDEECKKVMKDRINFILNIALANNQGTLILGAFGCGIFENDAKEVASLFNEALSNRFKNQFKRIIFAIPGDINNENLKAFQDEFTSDLR